jgi:hypothetical protein
MRPAAVNTPVSACGNCGIRHTSWRTLRQPHPDVRAERSTFGARSSRRGREPQPGIRKEREGARSSPGVAPPPPWGASAGLPLVIPSARAHALQGSPLASALPAASRAPSERMPLSRAVGMARPLRERVLGPATPCTGSLVALGQHGAPVRSYPLVHYLVRRRALRRIGNRFGVVSPK